MNAIRRIKRNVAKVNMKRRGLVQICKGKPSCFSLNWREWVKR